jgi:predicted PhzF superfamily epimerase YddE/YHI9
MPAARHRIATRLDFSETVFVTDVSERRVVFVSPHAEVDFAGHAAVGAACLLNQAHCGVTGALRGRAGLIDSWQENDAKWVPARLASTPSCGMSALLIRGRSTGYADRRRAASRERCYGLLDEPSLTIRARTFAADFDVVEDEGNGSGCMRLAAALGRRVRVVHGGRSIVHAAPHAPGVAAVGGLVVSDGTRVVRW